MPGRLLVVSRDTGGAGGIAAVEAAARFAPDAASGPPGARLAVVIRRS